MIKREVILHNIHWEGRSNTDISKELRCTPENVRLLRNQYKFPKYQKSQKPPIKL